MYSDLLIDPVNDFFNIFNSKLKKYLPDSVRYIILVTIIITVVGLIYTTGILNYLGKILKMIIIKILNE